MTDTKTITAEILGGSNDGLIIKIDSELATLKIPVYMQKRDEKSELVGFDLCEYVCLSKVTNRIIYRSIRRLPIDDKTT